MRPESARSARPLARTNPTTPPLPQRAAAWPRPARHPPPSMVALAWSWPSNSRFCSLRCKARSMAALGGATKAPRRVPTPARPLQRDRRPTACRIPRQATRLRRTAASQRSCSSSCSSNQTSAGDALPKTLQTARCAGKAARQRRPPRARRAQRGGAHCRRSTSRSSPRWRGRPNCSPSRRPTRTSTRTTSRPTMSAWRSPSARCCC